MYKPKKSGANLYIYRVKTGLKLGGQFGYIGSSLSKEKVETLINENKLKVKEIYHEIKGNPSKKPIVKYRLGIEINSYVEKHIFKFKEESNELLPKEFYTDVTYDNSIKALTIELGSYNVIAYERLSDFFSVITNDVIQISNATLVNFNNEFILKSKLSLLNIENNLLNGKTINTDETGSKNTGKKGFVRNYSNENNVLYKQDINQY